MRSTTQIITLLLMITMISCGTNRKPSNEGAEEGKFAGCMVQFKPFEGNPVFKGTEAETWDKQIRERGYIILEEGVYKMWYTGYNEGDSGTKYLGYATSADGINWNRYSGNPVFSGKWTEDMIVIKDRGTYYMYAEGLNDVAHLLTSGDGISWQEQGDLVILNTNGEPLLMHFPGNDGIQFP